ncbi:MAG TPA: ABC transporter substrate-binding protein [Acidimicrobiia bacterium]|nr:ABC transporter substrate-binding protein [Acidimicrobiia bacterium]
MRNSGGRSLSRPARRRLRALAALLVLALVAAACGGGDRDDETTDTTSGGGNGDEAIIDTSNCTGDTATGIEGNVIKLGTSLPQSGLYSAFAEILRGESAYFEYVNEELGGVEIAGETYQIELVNRDDEYQAEQTVAAVTELINDESVFALFNVVGTKNNLAIRDLVNDQCVPNLFAATGSPAWGNTDYPWTLGTALVPYPLEMKALVDYLSANDPDASIAVLRANDDFGAAYSETLKSLIEGTDLTIAGEETYNVELFDTKSQITSLAATNADVLVVGATLIGCPDALINVGASSWEPMIYMSGTCTSKTLMEAAGDDADGVFTVLPTLDPANPANDSNEAMALYKEKVAQYQSEADPTNGIVAYGWTAAALLVELLEQSPAADRVAVMETARAFEASDVGILRPGATVSTSADDWFLGETFSLVQYNLADQFFADVGDLIEEDGNTAEYTPESLING